MATLYTSIGGGQGQSLPKASEGVICYGHSVGVSMTVDLSPIYVIQILISPTACISMSKNDTFQKIKKQNQNFMT